MKTGLDRLLDSRLDWRALSCKARVSGISYRLSNGQEGEITDPRALRTFYYRLYEKYQTRHPTTPGPAPQ